MIAWMLDIVCIQCDRDLNGKGNMRLYKVTSVTAGKEVEPGFQRQFWFILIVSI